MPFGTILDPNQKSGMSDVTSLMARLDKVYLELGGRTEDDLEGDLADIENGESKEDKFGKAKLRVQLRLRRAWEELEELLQREQQRQVKLWKSNQQSENEEIKKYSAVLKMIEKAQQDVEIMQKVIRKRKGRMFSGGRKFKETTNQYVRIVEIVEMKLEEIDVLKRKYVDLKHARREGKNKNARGWFGRGKVEPAAEEGGEEGSGVVGNFDLEELEDFDSPEIREALAGFEVKQGMIDDVVEDILIDVYKLKDTALIAQQEVEMQNILLDNTLVKTEANVQHAKGINKKMRKVLREYRPADRLIVDLILVMVILGIVSAIVLKFV